MQKSSLSSKTNKNATNWIEIRNCLQESINRSTAHTLIEYESQKRNLVDMLKATANIGEGNSVIIIGPKGSGKTTLVKTSMDEVLSENNLRENTLLVNLNGQLQTDDRIAINEITRQLHLENSCGDRVFGSFAENLAFLLESLMTGNKQTKAVFFILDEFDLFCHHHNQTLLYNLFDVSQSSRTPLAVVGLTRRLDVLELLEKRVKSRFSHRQILLQPNFTFDQFLQFAEHILQLPEDFYDKKIASDWNNSVTMLLHADTPRLILKKLYNFTRDFASLKSFLVLPLYGVCPKDCLLSDNNFVEAWDHFSQDSKQLMLSGVSVLELCLLLSMRRLVEIYDGEPFNFEMVHKEYLKFSATRQSYNYDKRVLTKAFENLIRLELVAPVEGAKSKVQKGYRLMNLLVDPAQIMDTLQNYPNLPTEVLQWSSSLIS